MTDLFPTILEAGSPRSSGRQVDFFYLSSRFAGTYTTSSLCSHRAGWRGWDGRRERGPLCSPKGTNPIMGAVPSLPHLTSQGPNSKYHHVGDQTPS